MLARLIHDFEHAPLPHAFLLELYHDALPFFELGPDDGRPSKKRKTKCP